jgi:hypothetical protein
MSISAASIKLAISASVMRLASTNRANAALSRRRTGEPSSGPIEIAVTSKRDGS